MIRHRYEKTAEMVAGRRKMPSVHRDFLERLQREFGIAAISLDIDPQPDPRYERQFLTLVVEREKDAIPARMADDKGRRIGDLYVRILKEHLAQHEKPGNRSLRIFRRKRPKSCRRSRSSSNRSSGSPPRPPSRPSRMTAYRWPRRSRAN